MSDTPTYPNRPSFFAHRYCRLLTKTCAANDIGPTAFVLCVTIAMIEDSKRYTGPVTFYTGQLLPLIGATKWDTLDHARKKAVRFGWLCYFPGEHGKRQPGRYWVTIPDELEILDDSPCDETRPQKTGTVAKTHYPENGDSRGYRDGYRQGERQGELSYLTLDPTPDPEKAAPSTSKKLRFSDQDLQTAQWMYGLLLEMNPDHTKPNLEKWADTIRLTRERDNRSDGEIRQLFTWANNDDFWRANILSPDKLRSKWDALVIKRNSKHAGKSKQQPGAPTRTHARGPDYYK